MDKPSSPCSAFPASSPTPALAPILWSHLPVPPDRVDFMVGIQETIALPPHRSCSAEPSPFNSFPLLNSPPTGGLHHRKASFNSEGVLGVGAHACIGGSIDISDGGARRPCRGSKLPCFVCVVLLLVSGRARRLFGGHCLPRFGRVDQARLDGCTVSAGDTTYTSGNNKITLAAGLLHLQLPRALHKWHEDHRGHPIDYVC
uniref:Uncharacterized protein n=1 Tax=Oryza meridionalis TaxID=40149 RepID=A0A0E0CIN2_9ORYZ